MIIIFGMQFVELIFALKKLIKKCEEDGEEIPLFFICTQPRKNTSFKRNFLCFFLFDYME